MAAHTFSLLPISPSPSQHSCFVQQPNHWSLKLGHNNTLINTFVGPKLSIRSSNSLLVNAKNALIVLLWATKNYIKYTAFVYSDQYVLVFRWSARAIKSFAMAELEARKLKFPNTGTEALLMGILVEGTSLAAKFLRENGITLFKVREETVKLLGRSDMYFFSPEHPPLTEPAQRALDWAINEKLKSGETGEVTTTHFLLGIWSEKESAGYKILSELGFDDEKSKEIAKSMDKDFVFSFKKGI